MPTSWVVRFDLSFGTSRLSEKYWFTEGQVMQRILRSALILGVLATTLGTAVAAPKESTMELVIANGPHAGTFRYPGKGIFICMRQKRPDQLSAVYKDMSAKEPKNVSGVGFNVFSPDAAGAKSGGIRVVFGDPFNTRQQATYEVMIPRDSPGPLAMTRNGETVSLAFAGQTKDGIKLQLTMVCGEIDSIP
jgi:hypothetical protein